MVEAKAKNTAWGKAVKGLRAGLTRPKRVFAVGEPIPVTLELQCFGDKDYTLSNRPLRRCQLFPHVNFRLWRDGNLENKRVKLPIENRLIIRKGQTFTRQFEMTEVFDQLKTPGRYVLTGGHANSIITDIGDWTGNALSNPVEIEILPAAEETRPRLIETFKTERSFWKQAAIAEKLIARGDKSIVPEIAQMLKSEKRSERCNAAWVLAGLGDKRGLAAVLRELNDTSGVGRTVERTRSDGKPDIQGQIRQDRYYAAHVLGK
ncbi:unnamed protein product, partial [marine sediment metagenome]